MQVYPQSGCKQAPGPVVFDDHLSRVLDAALADQCQHLVYRLFATTELGNARIAVCGKLPETDGILECPLFILIRG